MTLVELAAQLEAAIATGNLQPDLARLLIAELAVRADAAERRELRDRLLAQAALALLPDESMWARAEALRVEIVAQHRRTGELDAARQLIAAALAVDSNTPRSARQLFAILKSTPGRLQTEQPYNGGVPGSPLSPAGHGGPSPGSTSSAPIPRRWGRKP